MTCRLRDDSGWSDLTIRNLSSHGLMAQCSVAPPRGSFVEVRKGGLTIVGQVRWSRDSRIGIRTQDRIDAAALLGEVRRSNTPASKDRRARERSEAKVPTPEELAERSRRWSRLLDWLVIAVAGIAAAGLVATQVHSLLAAPLEAARTALGG